MSAASPSIADVRRTLRHNGARLRRHPNVVALAVGGRVRDGERQPGLAIRVYVSRKLPPGQLSRRQRLPRRLRGRLAGGLAAPWFVPVDVVRGEGPLQALALASGQGIRGIRRDVGTTGLLYRSVLGRDYLLTNAHVAAGLDFGPRQLAAHERAGLSTAVSRPSNARAFADVERIAELTPGASNECDAALCWVYDSERVALLQVGGLPVVGVSDASPRSPERFFYRNRRGRKKTFSAPDERAPLDVNFSGRLVRFRSALTLTGAAGVEAGDSGSLLVRRTRGGLLAAGLVFAGSGNTVAVIPFSRTLAQLAKASAGRAGRREDVRVDFEAGLA
jgi:hypothetical protein